MKDMLVKNWTKKISSTGKQLLLGISLIIISLLMAGVFLFFTNPELFAMFIEVVSFTISLLILAVGCSISIMAVSKILG